jgi:N-acetylneuraminic acid mutarotase
MCIYVLGFNNNQIEDDNTWTEVDAKGTPPEPRSGHTAVVYNGSMYVYAGRNEQPRYFNDIYRFDFGKI